MEIIFKVAKYVNVDGVFEKNGYDEYRVTFLKDTKTHKLRIVVNNLISNHKINLLDPKFKYKDAIVNAVSDYVNGNLNKGNIALKFVKLPDIKDYFKKMKYAQAHQMIHNLVNYVLPINKIERRDSLTKYRLIK